MENYKAIAAGVAIYAAVSSGTVSAQITSMEGAKFEVRTNLENMTTKKACPKSSYVVNSDDGTESITVLAAGLISTFANKAVGAFVSWLEARKDRLNGTSQATFTGEFYNQNKIAAKCIIFSSGTINTNGVVSPLKVYAEFVPAIYDGGSYTLKPVYLEYNSTVAESSSKSGKFSSLVITTKINAPKSKNKDGQVNSTELTDGSTFTFNYGKLKENTKLDHQVLEAVNGGLGQMAPQIPGVTGLTNLPIAYEMNALWSETAKPSPLFTAAVETLSDNKDKIGEEIGNAIKAVLGLKGDPKKTE